MALGRNFHKSCGKDGGKVGENPAALRAAVFFAILEKPEGGGGVQTPPPPAGRGLIVNTIPAMGGECRMAGVAVATPTLPLPHQHIALLSLLATPTLTCWLIILCFGHTNFGNHFPPMIPAAQL